VDGRREAFVVDRAESDLVYVFASTTLDAGPVATDYDSRSLELAAASSTDDSSSRIQMMLALLRALGRRDAAPLFAEGLRAPHFHARWQAMREFLALDAELALPHLRRMAGSDPHCEVRAAAAETLAAFFPEPSPCPA
jgi:HEAT repeat protein